jgi:Mor family transcriptional regulator
MSLNELARKYQVSKASICKVLRGRRGTLEGT